VCVGVHARPQGRAPGTPGSVPSTGGVVRFSKFDFGNRPAVLPGSGAAAKAAAAAGKAKPEAKPDKRGLLQQVRRAPVVPLRCEGAYEAHCPRSGAMQLEARRAKLAKLKETNAPKV
jgi:hypothetical protein